MSWHSDVAPFVNAATDCNEHILQRYTFQGLSHIPRLRHAECRAKHLPNAQSCNAHIENTAHHALKVDSTRTAAEKHVAANPKCPHPLLPDLYASLCVHRCALAVLLTLPLLELMPWHRPLLQHRLHAAALAVSVPVEQLHLLRQGGLAVQSRQPQPLLRRAQDPQPACWDNTFAKSIQYQSMTCRSVQSRTFNSHRHAISPSKCWPSHLRLRLRGRCIAGVLAAAVGLHRLGCVAGIATASNLLGPGSLQQAPPVRLWVCGAAPARMLSRQRAQPNALVPFVGRIGAQPSLDLGRGKLGAVP